jgi:hypothetical protein
MLPGDGDEVILDTPVQLVGGLQSLNKGLRPGQVSRQQQLTSPSQVLGRVTFVAEFLILEVELGEHLIYPHH